MRVSGVTSLSFFVKVILMSAVFVAILMGSDSDLPVMENSIEILKKLGINYEDRKSVV